MVLKCTTFTIIWLISNKKLTENDYLLFHDLIGKLILFLNKCIRFSTAHWKIKKTYIVKLTVKIHDLTMTFKMKTGIKIIFGLR